jgi:hypothetical protein
VKVTHWIKAILSRIEEKQDRRRGCCCEQDQSENERGSATLLRQFGCDIAVGAFISVGHVIHRTTFQ